MLNNKGQSLILFVVVLPVLLLVLVLVIDIGRVIVVKQKLDNINTIVIDYGLEHLDKEGIEQELVELVQLNGKDIDDVTLSIEDGKIYSSLEESTKGIFSKIIDVSIFRVKSSYQGYITDSEKRIEKISG